MRTRLLSIVIFALVVFPVAYASAADQQCRISLPGGTRYVVKGEATELAVAVHVPEGCSWTATAEQQSASMFEALSPDIEGKKLDVAFSSAVTRRTGYITITAEGGRKARVQIIRQKVCQPRKSPARNQSEEDYSDITMRASAGVKKVKAVLRGEPYEKINWTSSVFNGEDWLSVAKETGIVKANKKGVATVSVALIAERNPTAEVREAFVEIEGYTLYVYQEGAPCRIDGWQFQSDKGPPGGKLPSVGIDGGLMVKVPQGCVVTAHVATGAEWFWSESFEEVIDEATEEVTGYEVSYLDEVYEYDEDENEVYVGQVLSFTAESNGNAERSLRVSLRAGTWEEKEINGENIDYYFKLASVRRVSVYQESAPGWTPCEIADMRIPQNGIFEKDTDKVSLLVAVPQHCKVKGVAPPNAYWLSGFDGEIFLGEVNYYYLNAIDHFDDDGNYQGKLLSFFIDYNEGKERRTNLRIKAGEYDEYSDTFRLVSKKIVPIIQKKGVPLPFLH